MIKLKMGEFLWKRYCNFLDKKEEKLLKVLTKDYEKFIGPGSIQKQIVWDKEKYQKLHLRSGKSNC